MASPAAHKIAAAQQLLPDEILEDIFLLLNSGADLARVSASCRSFRRVATGPRFLRRFLSLHPPPIVGLVNNYKNRGLDALRLVEPPHPSAPAAHAVVQAGGFTFSFLPSHPNPTRRWIVQDARDGRFLLARQGTLNTSFLQLVVCDPLHRRYVLIPSIPRDLVPHMPSEYHKSEPFLAPPSDEEETEEDQHFRVIYNIVSHCDIVSFLFSAATGKWCGVTSFCPTNREFFSLSRKEPFRPLPTKWIQLPTRMVRYYARSCFYWVHPAEKYMLMLDPCEMKFSFVELVLDRNCHIHERHHGIEGLAVMDAAEGRLGLLVVGDRTLDLYSRTCQNDGVEAEEWRHDKHLPLPETKDGYFIIGAAEGCILLSGYKDQVVQKAQCFTVIVKQKTLLVERLCALNDKISRGARFHSYSSFPPPLSLPRLLN